MGGTVSVIIPTYNGSAYLSEALASVLAQTLAPCEVIVVDDASTDATPDLVRSVAQRAPVPVRLIRLAKNSGSPARPINTALRTASGTYIAICDQDDVFCPDKLRDQVAVFEQHPEVVCVASLTGRFDKPESTLQPDGFIQDLEAAGEKKDGFVLLSGPRARRLFVKFDNFVRGYPGFLFRHRDWERKGGVNERFRIGSDFDFLGWLADQGPLALIERVHYLRRLHADNMTQHRLLMAIEGTLIRGRLATREPAMLRELGLSEELRDGLFVMGFKAREIGSYRLALQCHWVSLKLWGCDARTLKALGKLAPHWVYRHWLFPRKLNPSAGGTSPR